jgi:methionyl-tRNA formyltransferase
LSNDHSSLRLGFAGTPEFAVPALQRLASAYSIGAVFTQPDRPAGRGQEVHAGPVKRCALELGLSVHQPASFKSAEAAQMLRSAAVDALVVVAYGQILPAAVLTIPRLGCINIHASLLPRWRGAAPIQRALLAGDCVTGVTIMRMEAGLDTGPMLAVRPADIGVRDTAKTLHDRLAALGAELVVETLGNLADGGGRETPQPAEGVTYADKISKAEAPIDWQHAAGQISRQIRAFNPWPIAETRFNGEQLRIWDAESVDLHFAGAGRDVPAGTVLAATHEGIDVACGTGILRVLRLQLAGRKPLSAQEFLQGQRLTGACFAGT